MIFGFDFYFEWKLKGIVHICNSTKKKLTEKKKKKNEVQMLISIDQFYFLFKYRLYRLYQYFFKTIRKMRKKLTTKILKDI